MGKIRVDNDVLNSQRLLLRELSKQVGEISGRVNMANISLSWEISATDRIRERLRNAKGYLDNLTEKTRLLTDKLEEAAENYQATEWKNAGKEVAGSGQDTQSDSKKEFKLWKWDDTWNMVKAFGPVGAGLGTIGGFLTGGKSTLDEDPVKGTLKIAKDVTGLLEKGFKAVPGKEAAFDWKTLFGFQKGILEDTPTNLRDALGEQVSKYNIGKAKTNWGKAGVVAKWAGSLLTVATTAYDNFTDEENTTVGRKIAETVGESAVKIGEGILIGGAVTAGAAALGFVGAPVAVVGAITVGATWAIDKGFEFFTGKNAAEFISDGAIEIVKDVGETVSGVAKDVGEAIGDAVSSAGKAISGWWDGLTGVFAHA